MSSRILVVDDDPQIRRVLRATLASAEYIVDEARSGEEAVTALLRDKADLVLLDMNMPGIGGMETCRLIRTSSEVPIIVLTVRSAEKDKVEALDAGADDYVTKPFGTPELMARIRAALRRMPPSDMEQQRISLRDVEIDFQMRQAKVRGRARRLTPKEFDLLRYFVSHPNKAIPHRELLQAVWGPDYGDELEYLRVFVNQLRKKMEVDPANPRHLLTEPWVGYRFCLPDPK
jgi:two-component system, OmpR family, KDP operon response regulator KdpE